MTSLLDAAALRRLYVDVATTKFAAQVPDFVALQKMVHDNGGTFHNDHGAIRVADPQVTALFVQAAAVLGLLPDQRYAFPAKKLKSFDLQVLGPDAGQFKIFVSEVDLDAFPPAVAEQVRSDCAEQAAASDHQAFRELIAQSAQGLDAERAQQFVQHFVHRLMTRNGPPLRRSTLEAVAQVSGEAASALALGPDFNHITIDVQAAGYAGIDAMAAAMIERGFRMLPGIQGAAGTKLRQTATMAQTMDTPVREADGSLGNARTEKQFVEIIERGAISGPDGRPQRFKHFLSVNAEKIFDAASTRAGAGS